MSAKPIAATAKLIEVDPSSEASGSSGPSGCEKANDPQPNPPNGQRARSASPATQAAAAHSGQPGSRRNQTSARPTGAVSKDSAIARASQGTDPT